MAAPTFVPADLTELANAGVLMAVNELVLWPLGLALTWDRETDTGQCSGLHVRQWEYEDGHRETIALDHADAVGVERRAAFAAWAEHRAALLPDAERDGLTSIVAAFCERQG